MMPIERSVSYEIFYTIEWLVICLWCSMLCAIVSSGMVLVAIGFGRWIFRAVSRLSSFLSRFAGGAMGVLVIALMACIVCFLEMWIYGGAVQIMQSALRGMSLEAITWYYRSSLWLFVWVCPVVIMLRFVNRWTPWIVGGLVYIGVAISSVFPHYGDEYDCNLTTIGSLIDDIRNGDAASFALIAFCCWNVIVLVLCCIRVDVLRRLLLQATQRQKDNDLLMTLDGEVVRKGKLFSADELANGLSDNAD